MGMNEVQFWLLGYSRLMALPYHYLAALGRPFLRGQFIFQAVFMTEHTFCDTGDLQPVSLRRRHPHPLQHLPAICNDFWCSNWFFAQFSNIFPPILRVHYHTVLLLGADVACTT